MRRLSLSSFSNSNHNKEYKTIQEVGEEIRDLFAKHFPNGRVVTTDPARSLSKNTFFVTTFLIGDKKDQTSGLPDNDPMKNSYMIMMNGDFDSDKMVMEARNGISLYLKPEEGSYLAMKRLKIPFRKVKGDINKILKALDKEFAKLAKAVIDNKDDIYKLDDIPAKYLKVKV